MRILVAGLVALLIALTVCSARTEASRGPSCAALSRADVDHDGVISILDVATVAQHLGERTSHNHTLAYDQNGDRRITNADVQTVASFYLERTCPR